MNPLTTQTVADSARSRFTYGDGVKARAFNATEQEVRAMLAGTQTQFRRVVTATRGRPIEFVGCGGVGSPDWDDPECWGYECHDSATFVLLKAEKSADTTNYPCPYGGRGSRLSVRETWGFEARTEDDARLEPVVAYKADDVGHIYRVNRWRSSANMPRHLESDALAQGIAAVRAPSWDSKHFSDWYKDSQSALEMGIKPPLGPPPTATYRALWESANGPGSWDANPWVWAVSFKIVRIF
jgi:hypothetical protein